MRLMHEQFTEHLGQSMRKEFEAILEERRVVGCLNELDGLVEEARRRKAKGETMRVPYVCSSREVVLSIALS